MTNLNQDLEQLRKLNNLRDRAKEMREMALIPLRQIEDIAQEKGIKLKVNNKSETIPNSTGLRDWVSSRDQAEIALLVKVQNNRDINKENKANMSAEATIALKNRLADTKLQDLFDHSGRPSHHPVPVLTAALTMQGLISRAETVFTRATMVCYYRIVRELYEANPPDWMVGAARVGNAGRASAFVTSECVRAILGFQKSIVRTNDFLEKTKLLLTDYSHMRELVGLLGPKKDHPLYRWADRMMEVMGLDCYLSTNPRRRQIALAYCPPEEQEREIVPNHLRIFPGKKGAPLNVEVVGTYFNSLAVNFRSAVAKAKSEIEEALEEIDAFRLREDLLGPENRERFNLSESAHRFARGIVNDAFTEAENYLSFQSEQTELLGVTDPSGREEQKVELLEKLIGKLERQGKRIACKILKTLGPSKKYLKHVIYRELSANEPEFDAGELVFAATAIGAIIDWKDNDLLRRASEALVKALPENGKMTTQHPFDTNQSGYRLLPVEFEMSKSMAQLFEQTDFSITPETVERILSIFEDNQIRFSNDDNEETVGWNFLGSPTPDRPSVWATAVSVHALDRIVRMLNTRINKAVLIHFDVTWPDRRRKELKLDELIYPDHGFSQYPTKSLGDFYHNNFVNRHRRSEEQKLKRDMSIALYLQLMRGHVMRAALPEAYRDEDGEGRLPKVCSAILYGPPGTGKTTLAEALAQSSRRAVVRLSPSDLVVQGQELMEGRAKDVFDALNMLSQVVIVFDEFEQVLKRREPDTSTEKGSSAEARRERSENDKLLDRLGMELHAIGEKDDPKFKFLVTGMLPKFVKLHKSAEENSFVYFLNTNLLKVIDEAAQRPGRFDTKIPIYHPCPLSRAGTLVYRLIKENSKKIDLAHGEVINRIAALLRDTAGEPSSDLGRRFFNKKTSHFKHILDPDVAIEDFESTPKKLYYPKPQNNKEKKLNEQEWLNMFECFFRDQSTGEKGGANLSNLGDWLTPPEHLPAVPPKPQYPWGLHPLALDHNGS